MAAGATYEPISTQTLSNSTTQTVTFSSIPGTYTDLVLVINGGMNTTTGYALSLRLNSDTNSNYSDVRLYAPNPYSDLHTGVTMMYFGTPAKQTLNGNHILQFMNYSNTTTYKTVISRDNDADNLIFECVGMWNSTSAITSIDLSPEFTANWYSGTTFTLYGIAAA